MLLEGFKKSRLTLHTWLQNLTAEVGRARKEGCVCKASELGL